MILGEVMDEMGTKLDNIPNLRVLPYEADDIDCPAAVVSLPQGIDYLGTMARGMNSFVLDVTVFVSLVGDRIRRDQITPYADPTGPMSIPFALNTTRNNTYTTLHDLTVSNGRFQVLRIAKIDYLCGVWECRIHGQGN